MWHLMGIFVAGTYIAVAWYMNVADYYLLKVYAIMWSPGVDNSNSGVGHVLAMWKAFSSGNMVVM